MKAKMWKALWLVILGSFVLASYWIGAKRSVHSNPIDTSKYGMYRVLKDANDPNKGWSDWILVPRTSPARLLEAQRARDADRVAQSNRDREEAATRLANERQWYEARDSERRHTEAIEQFRASERDSERRYKVALEQARQARKPQVVVVPPQKDWRYYMDYYNQQRYDDQLREINRGVDELLQNQRR